MKRKEQALLSQSIMSLKKTIYVEGELDYKTIKCFLDSKKIKNVKVIEINQEVDDSDKPIEERDIAKVKVAKLIKKANRDKTVYSKYLGVIDLDYDFFKDCKYKVKNLLYTDYNSMESYFINRKLINKFLADFNAGKIDTSTFDTWLSNSLIFSFYFYFQISKIAELDSTETIDFKKLSICNPTFIDFGNNCFNLKNIVNAKTKCNGSVVGKFIDFFFEQDRKAIYENPSLFLHGKYTLRYLTCLLKNKFEQLKYLSYDTILLNLKDKFILYKYYKKTIFDDIVEFAK